MPCYTPPYTVTEEDKNLSEVARLKHFNAYFEAALCGALQALGENPLDKINWEEVGISKWYIENWWEDHKKKDQFKK